MSCATCLAARRAESPACASCAYLASAGARQIDRLDDACPWTLKVTIKITADSSPDPPPYLAAPGGTSVRFAHRGRPRFHSLFCFMLPACGPVEQMAPSLRMTNRNRRSLRVNLRWTHPQCHCVESSASHFLEVPRLTEIPEAHFRRITVGTSFCRKGQDFNLCRHCDWRIT